MRILQGANGFRGKVSLGVEMGEWLCGFGSRCMHAWLKRAFCWDAVFCGIGFRPG